MNKYKDNHEFYQSTFDEVHAPDELLRKVQNMSNTETKKKVYAIRKVIYIAAAIIIVFAASNAVVYAATGETWVEHTVHAVVNGDDYNAKTVNKYDDNGQVSSQKVEINYGNGMKEGIEYDGDYAIDENSDFEIQSSKNKPILKEENDKTYFVWSEIDIKIDITDDFKDGEAKFLVLEEGGNKLFATVKGTIDEYVIDYSEE